MLAQRYLKLFPYLLVFIIFFLPAIDTDLGWHLRYGDHFLKTGNVLKENTLTYFLSNYQWAYSTGFFDLLTAAIYKTAGLLGLAFAFGLLGVSLHWLFNRINRRPSILSFLSFLVVILFGWNVFYLGWRAQIFTFFFLVFELWIFKKSEENKLWLFVLPSIFALWGNIHGGFVLGLLLLCSRTLNQIYLKEWGRVAHSILLIIACSGAVLLNPYGYRVYQESLLHAQYPLQKLIAEWVPPSLFVKIMGVVIFGVLTFFLWAKKQKQKLFWTVVLILGLTLLFQGRRNTAFFALFAILASLETFKDKLKILETKKYLQQLELLTIAAAILVLALIRIPQTIEMSTNLESYCAKGLVKYPCKSAQFIRDNHLPGTNAFTAYEWGGFLEWQLPQYKYFVDGRMPAWDTLNKKSPYTEYLKIIQAQPGQDSQAWDKRLEEYKTDFLLIGSGTFLDIELKENQHLVWKETYRDNVSVVYTKKE